MSRGAPSIFDRRYLMEMGRCVRRRNSFWLSRLFKALTWWHDGGGRRMEARIRKLRLNHLGLRPRDAGFDPIAKHYSRLRAEELPQSMIAP
jgi:hypothetical protein